CTGLALAPVKLLGVAGTPVLLLIASFPILVLDRARAAVVLDGERAYHPKTFARALAYVARRPLWWLSGTLIEALKIGVGVAALMLVFAADFAGGSIWLARVGGLLAVALGLWRVSLAVDTRACARIRAASLRRSSKVPFSGRCRLKTRRDHAAGRKSAFQRPCKAAAARKSCSCRSAMAILGKNSRLT